MNAKAGLMRIEEASEYTGVPVSTLRYLRSHHRGAKSGLLAGRIVYRQEDLDAWIEEQFTNNAA